MSDVLELGKKRAEELGLELEWVDGPDSDHYVYRPEDIHKLLGEAKVVTNTYNVGEWFEKDSRWAPPNNQALLIGIRPIKQESEERKLLRELVSEITAPGWRGYQWAIPVDHLENKFLARAKALLEKPE